MIAQLTPHYIRTNPSRAVVRLASYAFFEGRPLTTRGRWINPLVFSILKVAASIPTGKRVVKPIFIVGMGRSGSTILGTVLSMHRHAGFLNEAKALWHSTYPREDVGGNYSTGPSLFRLGADDVDDRTRRVASRIFGAYLLCTGSRRIVDKDQELLFRVPFVRALFPDAKFVFLYRNGRDTSRSVAAWVKRNAVSSRGSTHDWWGVDNRKWKLMLSQLVPADELLRPHADALSKLSRQEDRAAVEWVLTAREGLRQKRLMGEDLHMLKFEALTESPQRELLKLLDYCELPGDKALLLYGCSVLHPVKAYPEFGFDSTVAQILEPTMRELGY